MTLQEIRAAIAASAELQALAVAGSFGPIATALSIGRTKLASHFASERGVLERFPGGPLAADALISKLEAFALTTHPMSSIVRRALKFLAQAQGLDIGSPATQGLIDALLSIDVITQTERNGLRAMATVAYEITVADVERAVREV
jgi:hypothetical protein